MGCLAALWFCGALMWLVIVPIFRQDIGHAMQKLATFGSAIALVGATAAGMARANRSLDFDAALA